MIKLNNLLNEVKISEGLEYHIQNDISLEDCVFRYGSKKYFLLMREAKTLMEKGAKFDYISESLLKTNLGEFAMYEGKEVPLDFPMINEDDLDEAKKKKKKDPPIGKPKRGGSKAYYVYVRNPKTKNIKKVSFGSGGLRAKINDPKKRKAFAARHKCSQKTDRTKASYWSCRLPRYAKQLGLSVKNPGAFW